MTTTPEMRASDGDRDRVAAALRDHMAEGRLTPEEFHERLDRVFQSRTYAELAAITSDLPEIDLWTRQLAVRDGQASRVPQRVGHGMLTGNRGAWAAWAAASTVNWVVWLLASIVAIDPVYPWPVWVMGPWGAVLLARTAVSVISKPRQR